MVSYKCVFFFVLFFLFFLTKYLPCLPRLTVQGNAPSFSWTTWQEHHWHTRLGLVWHFFLLTIFRSHLRSITEQAHGIMEYICWTDFELSIIIHIFPLSFAQVVPEPSRYHKASVKSYVRTQQLCSVAFCSVSKSCKSTDLTESYYIEGKECLWNYRILIFAFKRHWWKFAL